MPLLITELTLGDVNTISIPTDAIFLVSLLIIFALLGYFFNKILSNETNKLDQKTYVDANLELEKKKLEGQLTLEATMPDQKSVKKPSIKKTNFIPRSKLLRLGSFAFIAMGGATLLGLQNMQNSYEGMNTSRPHINLGRQSTKSSLSIFELKPLNKNQTHIKKITYIDPFLSTIKSLKDNHSYQIKEQQIENIFSF